MTALGILFLAAVTYSQTELNKSAYVAKVREGHIVTIIFLPNRDHLAKRLISTGRGHVLPELNALVGLPDIYLTTNQREANVGAVEALTRLPRIQEVGLGRLPVERSWLDQLAKLRDLKSLDLSYSVLGNEDLRLVCNMASLEYLRLDRTDQHAEFLFHLSRHSRLRQLELNHLIKKPPVRVLTRFDNLAVLSIARNGLSDGEINELRAELPKVTLRADRQWIDIDSSDLHRLSDQIRAGDWVSGPMPMNGIIKREGGRLTVLRQ